MVNRSPFFAKIVRQFRCLPLPVPPGRCLLCGSTCRSEVDICSPCQGDLPWLEPGCRRCAQPLPDPESRDLCGRCLVDPPHFSSAIACWSYRPPVSRVIAAYKYHRTLSYGRSLSLLMADQLASAYSYESPPDIVTDVPLHRWRYLRRGFNQSEAIARTLAAKLQLPYRPLLTRARATPAQQSLNAEQRRRNLRGAFRCREPLNGECVALVDDVITTGSTANEISRSLIAAGAREVHVWCLAKTPDE